MKAKIDTQTRMDPGASVIVDSGGQVFSAWVSEECDRILGQELTGREERAFSDTVQKAGAKELESWEHFRVLSPVQPGAYPKDLVDTHWVLNWKEVEGE